MSIMNGMRSPAPTEVMDITNMLNKKAGQMQQQMQNGLLDQSHLVDDPIMKRSVSPHGSEHSQYSTPHNIARSYPSPVPMQAPMHMSNPMPGMQLSGYPEMQNMGGMPTMPMQTHMPQHHQPPQAAQQPVKAYPCSTCGKGFARRSDLARHGKHPIWIYHQSKMLT
jgi:hypothetical protein